MKTLASDDARPRLGGALLLLLPLALGALAGCGDGGGDGGNGTMPTVISVSVVPDTLLFPVVGSTIQVTVTEETTGGPRDVTANPATDYFTGNSNVAAGVSGGTYIAQGLGATFIFVASGGFTDTSAAIVDTMAALAVSSVTINTGPISLTQKGETRGIGATAVWENGARFVGAGPPLEFSSDDPQVASIDENGIVKAETGEGSTIVRASLGGQSASVSVRIDPVAPVSFAQQILPLFTAGPSRCTDASCHPGSGPAERGLRMNSYENIVIQGSETRDVVVPGNGSLSLIVLVLQGARPDLNVEEQMPQGSNRPKFSSDTIDLIRRWIDEGAGNN